MEPLEYIKKFWQNKNIKAGNGFMYHLVQLHHIEIVDNKERIKKKKIRRNGKKKKSRRRKKTEESNKLSSGKLLWNF